MNKEREYKRLKKEKDKEKKQIHDLQRNIQDYKKNNNSSNKDYEAIIVSIYESLMIIMDISINNIDSFKEAICNLG